MLDAQREIADPTAVDEPSYPKDYVERMRCQALAWRLADAWRDYNATYVRGCMVPPVIQVCLMGQRLGAWYPETRELRISYAHVTCDSWHAVLATLRHEMAHQFTDEVLRAHGETAHGSAFRQACEVLRADPAARVRVSQGPRPPVDGADAEPAESEGTERLMRRVAKLLALGNSPNEHEAASAVQKARALILEYNLESVAANRERGFESRTMGGVSRRRHGWEAALFALLPEYFFVEVIQVSSYDCSRDIEGNTYEVFGTPANLAMAEYVYAYISSVLPGLWHEHRLRNGITGDRDRLQFFEGVVVGFRKRLAAEESARLAGENALVWRGDPALTAFYRYHHPRIRITQRGGGQRGDAFGAGQEAGKKLTLRRPLTGESSGFGGLLGG